MPNKVAYTFISAGTTFDHRGRHTYKKKQANKQTEEPAIFDSSRYPKDNIISPMDLLFSA
jgi:hypothetical protein